jgi:putative membrane protein
MKYFLLLAAAALLGACIGSEPAPPPADDTAGAAPADAAAEPGMPTDAAGYIAKAGAGDIWEIESSKALIERSKRDDVKAFARMMIDNHTKSTEMVKAAASAASIEVMPPALDADQQRMLNEIRDADAAAIDAIYLRHQKRAHEGALALHRAFAANGDTESLRTAAGEIAPVVGEHISKLDKLAGETRDVG